MKMKKPTFVESKVSDRHNRISGVCFLVWVRELGKERRWDMGVMGETDGNKRITVGASVFFSRTLRYLRKECENSKKYIELENKKRCKYG